MGNKKAGALNAPAFVICCLFFSCPCFEVPRMFFNNSVSEGNKHIDDCEYCKKVRIPEKWKKLCRAYKAGCKSASDKYLCTVRKDALEYA